MADGTGNVVAFTARSLDDMLATPDVEYREVRMPEWGGVLYIGSVSAADVIDWQESSEGEAKKTAGIRLIVKSLVNKEAFEGSPGGARIGSDKHIAQLKQKAFKNIEKVVKQIIELNGMDAKGKTTKMEADVKND